MLCNAIGGVGVHGSAQISVMKVHDPMFLKLRGLGGFQNSRKKCYVTLE